MIKIFFLLIPFLLSPSILLSGEWDGIYVIKGDEKKGWVVKNDKVTNVKCSQLDVKVTKLGNAIAKCGSWHLIIDFKNLTDSRTSGNRIIRNKLIKKSSSQPILKKVKGNSSQIQKTKLRKMTDTVLCSLATKGVNNNRVWETMAGYLDEVREAKRRGLSCGVIYENERPKNSQEEILNRDIKAIFNVLPLETKKLVQEALKDMGLYNLKIDGKWGKGTREAAKKFLRQEYPGKKDFFYKYELEKILDESIKKYKNTKSKMAKGNCDSNPKNCTDSRLCFLATVASDGKKREWEKRSSYYGFVREAKRRGLSCGIGSSNSTTKASNPSSLKGKSDFNICTLATVTRDGKIYWETSRHFRDEVREAKRRGLSCGVGSNNYTASNTQNEFANRSDISICTNATASRSGKKYWKTSSYYIETVKEAKRRGLSCGVYVENRNSCSKNLSLCRDDQVCSSAVNAVTGIKKWETSPHYKKWVKEAKSRGLSCGVKWSDENSSIATLVKKQILEKINNNWNVVSLKRLPNFEKYKVTLEIPINSQGRISGSVKMIDPKNISGNFVLAKRVAVNAVLDSVPFAIPSEIFPNGLILKIVFDPENLTNQKKSEIEREEKKAEEEEKRKSKEKKIAEKVDAYKKERSLLTNDVKNYNSENEDFDVIKLGELFLDLEKSLKKGWGKKTIEAYETFRKFVFSSENFKSYYEEKVKDRLNEYSYNLEIIKDDLRNQLPVIENFISNNLGSEKISRPIKLSKLIKEEILSESLEGLEDLKEKVDSWLKENNLSRSITIQSKVKEDKSVISKSVLQSSLKINTKSFDLTKEVGDGFDNFEAMENTFLFPLKIEVESEINDLEKRIYFVLSFEGMSPINPDLDASKAFGAQEGIDYYDADLVLKSWEDIGIVFIIPLNIINRDEATVSVFVDKTLVDKKQIEISR